MELDSKIESLCRLRKKLSYSVAGVWIVMFGPILILFLLQVSDLNFLLFAGLAGFSGFLSVCGIRNGKLGALFALSFFTYLLVRAEYNVSYNDGVWTPNWPSFVFSLILIGLYLLSILVIARHLWLMRKARLRDEKLAVQEG